MSIKLNLLIMTFSQDYKYSNNGYEVISAKEGEDHPVISSSVESFEDLCIAEVKSTVEEITVETKAPVINPSTGKDDGEDGDGEEEIIPDDLTAVHKIGEVSEKKLNDQNIHTVEELLEFAQTEDGEEFLVGLRGITTNDIPRMIDQMNALLEG